MKIKTPQKNLINNKKKPQEKININNKKNLSMEYYNNNFEKGIVSYDLFDTLVFRYCKEPNNIFDIVADKIGDSNFSRIRKNAQELFYSSSNYKDIDDIYKIMISLCDYDENQLEKYKQIEIETEIEYIYPNNELFLKLKPNDIIVSDMYLKEEHLKKILKKCIDFNKNLLSNLNDFDFINNIKIYVNKDGKSAGHIWEKIKESFLFHIGDNIESDFKLPKKQNIKTIHYEINTEFCQNELYLNNKNNTDLAKLIRFLRLLNPYIMKKDLTLYNLYKTLTTVDIPLLCLYAKYISTLDNDILFILRDCYYLKIIYDLLFNKSNSKYLQSSRLLFRLTSDDYLKYFNENTNDNSILVDLHATGWSLSDFYNYHKLNNNIRLLSICNCVYTTEFKNFKWLIEEKKWKFNLGEAIECMNSNFTESNYDLKNNKFYKYNNEFDEKLIKVKLNIVILLSNILINKNININYNEEIITNLLDTDLSYLNKIIPQLEHKKKSITNNENNYHILSIFNENFIEKERQLFKNFYFPYFDKVNFNTVEDFLEINKIELKNILNNIDNIDYIELLMKPYLIKKELELLNTNDVLIYQNFNHENKYNNLKYIQDYKNVSKELFNKVNQHFVIKIDIEISDITSVDLLETDIIFIKKTEYSNKIINDWFDKTIEFLIINKNIEININIEKIIISNVLKINNYKPYLKFRISDNIISLKNIFFFNEYDKINIHFISFHTMGEPFDKALNLSIAGNLIKKSFENYLDNISIYNSNICSFENPNFIKDYLTIYNDYNKGQPSRGYLHGFWKWKPYIIKRHLTKLKDGEILFYQDSNCLKYKTYTNSCSNIVNTINLILQSNNQLDVFVPFDHDGYLCEQHVKNDVFAIIGDESNYYKKFRLLHANRIIIRKTELSLKFVDEWLNYCMDDKLLLPEKTKEPTLRWHTHDQAILSVLYRKYIKDNKFPENYTGFYCKNNIFAESNIVFIN